LIRKEEPTCWMKKLPVADIKKSGNWFIWHGPMMGSNRSAMVGLWRLLENQSGTTRIPTRSSMLQAAFERASLCRL